MPWRKLRFLIVVVVFAAAGRSEVQEKDSAAPRPALLLPVQSTKARDLGGRKLLVASRKLGDPNFVHTVVLLIHYDEEGVVGLILNRRTRVPLSRVLQLEAAKDRTDPVYLGGPVEPGAVFALLQSPGGVEGAERMFDGVYQIKTKSLLEKAVSARSGSDALRVYVGYAGWSDAQLRMELELGSWFIFPGNAATVFDADPDSLWSRMIRKTELELAASRPRPR